MRNEFAPGRTLARPLAGPVEGDEDDAYVDDVQTEPQAQVATAVLVPTRATPVASVSIWKLPPAHFAKQARTDMAVIANQRAVLEGGVPYVEGDKTLRFGSISQRIQTLAPLLGRPPTHPYTVDELNSLRSVFADLLESLAQLDSVGKRYDNYYLHPTHDGFAVGNALYRGATALEAKHAIAFYQAVGGNLLLSRMLDEASPKQGLPAGAFTRLEDWVGGISSLLELRASQVIARRAHVDQAAVKNPGLQYVAKQYRSWMRNATERDHAQVSAALDGIGILIGLRATGRSTKRSVLQLLNDTLVKPIATWFGDTRVGAAVASAVLDKKHAPNAHATKHWEGERMVKPAQVKQLIGKLEPGDVAVARQDWFLSNLKLPGHWPHAMLHIGAPSELAAYFDNDADVKKLVSDKSAGKYTKFSEYLAAQFPDKWQDYQGLDEHGEPKRVLEAISEGVSFTGPAHAFFVDYLGVMRPRVSKTDKAIAIERAFGMAGLPYDFNFDFATANKIVCSELVYRAYQRGDGIEKGLSLPLTSVPDLGGRFTMPAGTIVDTFDKEHDKVDRQLDFVAYLQGDSKTQTARFAGEVEFQKSHALPQYDWQLPAAIDKLKKQAAEHAKLGEPWEFRA